MPIFRPHRWHLAESLQHCIRVTNMYELGHAVKMELALLELNIEDIEIQKYGREWDERIGWNTHMVLYKDNTVGFLSENLDKERNDKYRFKPKEVKSSLTDQELVELYWSLEARMSNNLAEEARVIADAAAKRAIEDYERIHGAFGLSLK